MTAVSLPGEDNSAILGAIDDFAKRAVEPLVARAEAPVSETALLQVMQSAVAAGILPGAQESGLALWERATAVPLSLDILHRLARTSAGIAYRFHLHALSHLVARRLGREPAETLVAWEGASIMGKGALASLLQGTSHDHERYGSLFPQPGTPAYAHAYGPWRQVILPFWNGKLGWRIVSAQDVEATLEPAPHGLQETPFYRFDIHAQGEEAHHPEPERILIELLAAHAAGTVAIGLGSVERALGKAHDYAAMRKQGGGLLREHAAILQFLGEASVTVGAVDAMLLSLTKLPGDGAGLTQILRIRAAAHPLLCAAANRCLQVFGGYGYMQDYGLEKVVRDCNTLRLIGGGTNELRLHVAQDEVLRWR